MKMANTVRTCELSDAAVLRSAIERVVAARRHYGLEPRAGLEDMNIIQLSCEELLAEFENLSINY